MRDSSARRAPPRATAPTHDASGRAAAAPRRRARARPAHAGAPRATARDARLRAGQAARDVRDPHDVGDAGSPRAPRTARPAPCRAGPAATASMASHIAGATAGAASTLAGSETSDACPKCSAMSGAVPSVAAAVSAVASARPRGSPRRTQPVADAPGEQEDGDDGGEAQLPADVLDRARVERQRRPPSRAAARASAPRAAPPAPRPPPPRPSPPPAGSTARRRRAGRRARWRRARARAASAGASPSTAATASDERGEQHHVLPARRHEVRRAPRPGTRRACARAARRRRRGPCRAASAPCGGGHAGAQRRLRARADAVDDARRGLRACAPVSASASARSWACTPRARCQASEAGSGSSPPRTASTAPTRSVGQRTPRPVRSSTRSPSSRAVATRAPNGARPRRVEEHDALAHGVADARRQPRRVERLQARLRDQRTGQRPRRRAPGAPPRARPSAGAASAASSTASGARGPASRPATTAAVPDVPRPRAQLGERRGPSPRSRATRQHHADERHATPREAARAAPWPREHLGADGSATGDVPPPAAGGAQLRASAPRLTAGPCPAARRGASARCPGSRRGRRSSESRRAGGGTRGSCSPWPGRRRRACRAARPSRC